MKKDIQHTEIVEQHKNILFSPTTLPFDIVKCECGKFYFDKNYCIIRFTSPSVTKVPKL